MTEMSKDRWKLKPKLKGIARCAQRPPALRLAARLRAAFSLFPRPVDSRATRHPASQPPPATAQWWGALGGVRRQLPPSPTPSGRHLADRRPLLSLFAPSCFSLPPPSLCTAHASLLDSFSRDVCLWAVHRTPNGANDGFVAAASRAGSRSVAAGMRVFMDQRTKGRHASAHRARPWSRGEGRRLLDTKNVRMRVRRGEFACDGGLLPRFLPAPEGRFRSFDWFAAPSRRSEIRIRSTAPAPERRRSSGTGSTRSAGRSGRPCGGGVANCDQSHAITSQHARLTRTFSTHPDRILERCQLHVERPAACRDADARPICVWALCGADRPSRPRGAFSSKLLARREGAIRGRVP